MNKITQKINLYCKVTPLSSILHNNSGEIIKSPQHMMKKIFFIQEKPFP